MTILMSGLDHSRAELSLREKMAFTKAAAAEMVQKLAVQPSVHGAVLLSTCNRTEVYLSCEEELAEPGRLLCMLSGCDYDDFDSAFINRKGRDCVRHLMEVSCGLHSRILGEDQILTQVKAAAALAQEQGTLDPVLATLFRNAAACGKAVKTELHLKGISGSAAESAVRRLENLFDGLTNRRVLVIGNGEMGRLSAALLRDAGGKVTVTLWSYRRGETLVPAGCSVVPYDERYCAMEEMDAVISATTSPHYTVRAEQFARLEKQPEAVIDLAIPRDIEPEIRQWTALYNIDDLGVHTGLDGETDRRVQNLVSEYMERFYHWCHYRECIPAMEELREAVLARVRWHFEPEMELREREAAEEAADRTIALLLGGLSDSLSPEQLHACAQGIRARTR